MFSVPSSFAWFNPSWQLNTTEQLTHSLPCGMEKRIGGLKGRKLVGGDQDSLKSKSCAYKENKTRNSFAPSHQQQVTPTSPSRIKATWEDSCHHSKQPTFLLLPQISIAEHDVKQNGISLWSTGVSCPRFVQSQPFVHPQPTRWCSSRRSRKGLNSVLALLSNNERVPSLSTLFSAQIANIAPY